MLSIFALSKKTNIISITSEAVAPSLNFVAQWEIINYEKGDPRAGFNNGANALLVITTSSTSFRGEVYMCSLNHL